MSLSLQQHRITTFPIPTLPAAQRGVSGSWELSPLPTPLHIVENGPASEVLASKRTLIRSGAGNDRVTRPFGGAGVSLCVDFLTDYCQHVGSNRDDDAVLAEAENEQSNFSSA